MNHSNKARMVSIPKESSINEGDYVILKKIELSGEMPLSLNFDRVTNEFIDYAMNRLDISKEEVIQRAVQELVARTGPKKKLGRPPTFAKVR